MTVVENDGTAPDAAAFDKVILSPGPGVPSEDAGTMKSIIGNFAASRSILGICLGHQAIAEFYGARLTHLSRVYHGIKAAVTIADPSDYLFAGLPPKH